MSLQCHSDLFCEFILQEFYRKLGVIFLSFSVIYLQYKFIISSRNAPWLSWLSTRGRSLPRTLLSGTFSEFLWTKTVLGARVFERACRYFRTRALFTLLVSAGIQSWNVFQADWYWWLDESTRALRRDSTRYVE